jgi:poly(3-hydroxybutyrate) depolymerase
MRRILPLIVVCSAAVLLLSGIASAAGPKIEKTQIDFGGQKRTYYYFVPASVKPNDAAPLLLLLHGSGQNGESLVKTWKDLAAKEGIILAGPDAINPRYWDSSADSADFLLAVITDLMAGNLVDPERLYIFGHSAGAKYGLLMGLLESQYFAAVAVHAGSLQPNEYQLTKQATRKIPMAIWAGQWDEIVPLDEVTATVDALKREGFTVRLTQMNRHTHNYYATADEVNYAVWQFLKDRRNSNPQFTHYDWSHPKALK